MTRHLYLLLFVSLVAACASLAHAEVKLAPIFTDHMVLQQNKHIAIFGTAQPGEKVTVTFGDASQQTTGDQQGRWKVELPPLPGTAKGRTLSVNDMQLKDVVVGEVWIAAGQSNMLGNRSDDKPNPMLRVLKRQWYPAPIDTFRGQWQISNKGVGTATVAYGFAKEIIRTQKVPVGIIAFAQGSTGVDGWITPAVRREMTPDDKRLHPITDAKTQLAADLAELKKLQPLLNANRAKQRAFDARIEAGEKVKWPHDSWKVYTRGQAPAAIRCVQYQRDVKAWEAASIEAKKRGDKLLPARPKLVKPRTLYTKNIQPLEGMTIGGFLWYQGEANGNGGFTYVSRNTQLIQSWRKAFGQHDETLPWVQSEICPVLGYRAGIHFLREAQRKVAMIVPRVGISINNDRGPGPWTDDDNSRNVHPHKKEEIGRRMALWARAQLFGERDLVHYGPWFKTETFDGPIATITFDHVGTGLASRDDKPLTYFTLAGKDRVFHPAVAKIVAKDQIEVTCDKVQKPISIRFAFDEYCPSNLMNKEGLSAAAFRSDDWPDILEGKDRQIMLSYDKRMIEANSSTVQEQFKDHPGVLKALTLPSEQERRTAFRAAVNNLLWQEYLQNKN